MKKFLIMLTVVAMASFLFVGCTPTAPAVDEEVVDEEALPASTTPVIETIGGEVEVEGGINLYSSDIQYINKDKAKSGILVEGYAPKYSTVQVYINGIVVGTSTAYGGDEMFKVFISKTSLGVDGVKTLYATTIEVGLDESTPSTAYAFTLDTVAPKIVSVAVEVEDLAEAAIATDITLTVICSEAIDKTTLDDSDADSTDIWDLVRLKGADADYNFVDSIPEYDLPSPEVIELSGKVAAEAVAFTLGEPIRVAYEPSEAPADTVVTFIKDLAGNKLAESVHYCYLELED